MDDERFSHIPSDPKYRPMSRSQCRVDLDPRFSSVLTDPNFSPKTRLDKRGRPLLDNNRHSQQVLHRFYNLTQDDSPHSGQVPSKKRRTGTSAVAQDDDEDSASSNDSSEDSVSSDDSSEEEKLAEFTSEHILAETQVDHKWNELQEEAQAIVESTHRLAVCNMDWDFVKAQDLFVLFRSFSPEGGNIESVTIYPSEFGKQRMAEEVKLGPKEMRLCDNLVDSAEIQKGRKKKQKSVDQQQMKQSKKESEATNTEKLREYQLNRLRYYFAVVVCDSALTAENIYNECDGREYLLSSVRIDLRFIPDNMTFDDPPKESFSQENKIVEYEPNRFSSTALCQAKVDVTWDETDFDRLSRRVAGLQHKELENIVEENKYADIIAPPESDSDKDDVGQPGWLKQTTEDGSEQLSEEDKISLYRKLLIEKLDYDDDKEDGDKEYVWQPGLKSSLTKQMQRKEKTEGDVVKKYLEKRREKKRKTKDKKKNNEVENFESVTGPSNKGEVRVTGPNNKGEVRDIKHKKKQSASLIKTIDTEENRSADLELLVMGNSDTTNTDTHSNSGKNRKRLKRKNLIAEKSEGVVDVNDARFSAIYTSHHFHIDPTAAQFKKTKCMDALVNEQIKRMGQYGKNHNKMGSSVQNNKSVSQTLVESLKSKIKKLKSISQ